MATPILEIPEVSTSILSFALLNIVLRHYEQAASNRIINSLSVPPSPAADGDAYFVLSGATGLWSGQSGKIAFSISGAWYFMNAIPQIPYYKSSTNSLVTLNPTTATEGVFSTGGGGGTTSSGATYYDVAASASGAVSIPWNSYTNHAIVSVDCSATTADFIGLNLNLASLTGTTGGKKLEITFYNTSPNTMYVYNAGSFGSYNLPGNDAIYRSNNLFFITYEVNFTTSTIVIHDTSQPTTAYDGFNYSTPTPNTAIIEGRNKNGYYTYDGASLSAGGATLTLTWDDTYIQNVYVDVNWKIVIFNLPPTVTNVVVAAPSGASSSLQGLLTKTPVNGSVTYEWVFSTFYGGFVVS
jgi:hypothetical protein